MTDTDVELDVELATKLRVTHEALAHQRKKVDLALKVRDRAVKDARLAGWTAGAIGRELGLSRSAVVKILGEPTTV